MPLSRRLKILIPAAVLIALGAAAGVLAARYYRTQQNPAQIQGLLWPDPKQLHAFTTVADTGGDFGIDQLHGKWSFIYFGYTHCQDTCPFTVSVMSQVYHRLQQQHLAGDVQMLFVTVDPERDTSRRLAGFLRQYDSPVTGLGGSPAQVRSLASQIGVAFSRGESGKDGGYEMNHSAALFLVGPEGRLLSLFYQPLKPDAVIDRLQRIRAFLRQQT